MATNPNQIKSATSNRGTFDGTNPDITMSIGEFSGGSLWDYLAAAVQKGPIEKTRVLEVMKSRLEATLAANGFTPDGTYIDNWEAGNISLDKATTVSGEMIEHGLFLPSLIRSRKDCPRKSRRR